MANTKSTQHEIDLTSELNLNKFKADIKPYNGFNERNAPYYGGALSPLWIKDEGIGAANIKYYKGHKYSIEDNQLMKDGTSVLNLDSAGFSKERLSSRPGFENIKVLEYYNDNNYVTVNSNNKIVVHYKYNNDSTAITTTLNVSEQNYIKSVFVNNNVFPLLFFIILEFICT